MISVVKNLKSFRYAFKGIYALFKNENNARIHLVASIAVVILGFYFKISTADWCWLTVAIGFVWVIEGINTAIEKIVDLVSPEFNQKAGEIKDLAAGAVLIAAGVSIAIGILVFKNYIPI